MIEIGYREISGNVDEWGEWLREHGIDPRRAKAVLVLDDGTVEVIEYVLDEHGRPIAHPQIEGAAVARHVKIEGVTAGDLPAWRAV